jgi:uncharacterized protein
LAERFGRGGPTAYGWPIRAAEGSPGVDIETAIRELGAPNGHLPKEAIRWARDHWEEVAPIFLQALRRFESGEDAAPAAENVLFYGVHLMAERREEAAFAPLCRLLHDRKRAEKILGVAVTETLPRLLISFYDGNQENLRQLIEGLAIDQFIRYAGLLAWTYLTFSGQIPEAETEQYLLCLYKDMQPQDYNYVWVGFAESIAYLGMSRHRSLVEGLFERRFFDPFELRLHEFDELLTRGSDEAGRARFFEDERLGPFTDTIEAWEGWPIASEEDVAIEPARPDQGAFCAQQPVENPYRHVGRNDPCPCGSGKKFKKCCLGAAEAA